MQDNPCLTINRQVAVNLTAPFLCSQKLLPALKASGGALYLASDESAYVNGSVITLDGGRSGLTPGTF